MAELTPYQIFKSRLPEEDGKTNSAEQLDLLRKIDYPASNTVYLKETSILSTSGYFEKAGFTSNFECNTCYFSIGLVGTKLIFNEYLSFENSVFAKGFMVFQWGVKGKANFKSAYFKDRVVFSHCVFDSDVLFEKVIFKNNVTFETCRFEGGVSFVNAIFEGKVTFEKCTFKDSVDFSFRPQNKDENDNKLGPILTCNFSGSLFEGEAKFYQRHFSNAKFDRTRFIDVVDFHSTVFTSPICFNQTEFHNTAIFSKSEFNEVVVFAYTRVSLNLSLHYAKIKNGINLAFINFINNGNLELFEVEIDNFVSVPSKCQPSFDAQHNWKVITHEQKQETYRLLKHQAILHNNKIQALENHAEEMEAYRLELKSSVKRSNKDRMILWFNRVSNGYGLDWGKGLRFIGLASIPAFLLYWFSLAQPPIEFNSDATLRDTWQSFGYILSHFLQFVNPTHSIDFMEDLGPWSKAIDMVSRVFIGLGIYQTIQAFRKYGRF